jgi:DNA-binding transcriptional MerR regulator
MTEESEGHPRTYQIGTVSTLTGIDPHTIRAWERRYAAVKPMRTESGRRRYDDSAVERLQLLKALIDCNEGIGTVANLSDAELRARLEKLAFLGSQNSANTTESAEAPRTHRIALMAPGLESQLRANSVAIAELDIVVAETDREIFLEDLRRQPCDIIALELESVGPGPAGFVRACSSLPGSPLVIVLYQFAPRVSLARLAQSGAKLIKTPLRLDQLRRAIQDQVMIEQATERRPTIRSRDTSEDDGPVPQERHVAPNRLFDDDQLARLFEVSTSIECECPNHLSSLVSALVAFEAYSRACVSLDEANAKVHKSLEVGSGEARALLERLLVDLCEHEGIVV